jgi:hypothetical protein
MKPIVAAFILITLTGCTVGNQSSNDNVPDIVCDAVLWIEEVCAADAETTIDGDLFGGYYDVGFEDYTEAPADEQSVYRDACESYVVDFCDSRSSLPCEVLFSDLVNAYEAGDCCGLVVADDGTYPGCSDVY